MIDRLRTRREALKMAGAAALAVAAAPGAALAEDKDPFGGFRMGVQSYSLRGFSFEEALAKIKGMGLKHVEVFPGHFSHQGPGFHDVAKGKEMLAAHGIVADAYGVVGFSKDEKAARAIFEFAKSVGLISISCDPGADSFDMLDKLVAEYDIPVAIHNHGPKHKWGDPNVILKAVKDHDKRIGLCCDCGHFLRSGVNPTDAIKILEGRVYGFHIKDFVNEETEMAAGEGKLDMVSLLKEARAQGFKGACSLEYELDEKDPIAGMTKGVENFKKAVAALG